MDDSSAEIIHSPRSDPFFLLNSNGDHENNGPKSMNMTICAETASFAVGPSSSSSFATNDSAGTASSSSRHENEYLKELADLLQDTLNRPDSLQGVDKPALMDFIKQLRQQSRDRKDNAVQHEDVSSSGSILLASHIGPRILEYLDGFFFVMNTDGFIEYISPNVSKYLKYCQSDMLNKPIYNFVNAGDHDLFSALLPDAMVWNLLDFNSPAPSSSSGNKERRSHRFMCRFLENSNPSNSEPVYQNLQVAAISLPLPASDAHQEDDFQLSFNVMMESQPCLVCVARRLPEICMTSDYEGCQFSICCASSGFIYSSSFKDKSLKQLFPKDFHRVQIQHFCHLQDLALLNSILKEDRGSRTAQLRLISPVLKLPLLLQVRSKVCTEGLNFEYNNFANKYESMVDTTANFPFIQLDFTVLRQNEATLDTSLAGRCGPPVGAGPGLDPSSQCSPAAVAHPPTIYDNFGDVFFADEYLHCRETPKAQQHHHHQQQLTFSQFSASNFGQIKGEKFVGNTFSSLSNPVTPLLNSSAPSTEPPGSAGRCPSTVSEPVSSTGQDDLQRICQMFSISGDPTDFTSPIQQQNTIDFGSASNLMANNNNYADYSVMTANNVLLGPSTSSNSNMFSEVEVNCGKPSSEQQQQQHIILKELLSQEEQQQQRRVSSSSLSAASNAGNAAFPPPPNLFPALDPAAPSFPLGGPASSSRGGSRKQSKGGGGRRGGGTRKNSKKSTQMLESLLKPEFSAPPVSSPSIGGAAWCSASSGASPNLAEPPPLRRHSGSVASPPQILQQLLQEDDVVGDATKPSPSSMLGKRRSVGSRQQAVRDFALSSMGINATNATAVSANQGGPQSVTPPATAGGTGTVGGVGPQQQQQKSESLLVQLLEKPLSAHTSQTRSLPTSIANTQFDKIAKENKENPSKQPIISTLIVESLLNKTKSSTTVASISTQGLSAKAQQLPQLNGPSLSGPDMGRGPLSPACMVSPTSSFMQGPGQHVTFLSNNSYNTPMDNDGGFFMPGMHSGHPSAAVGGLEVAVHSQFQDNSMPAGSSPFPNQDHQYRLAAQSGLMMESGNGPRKQMPPSRFPSMPNFETFNNMSPVLPSPNSTDKPPLTRFQVTPTPSNVRQQILMQQQKRGRGSRHQNANAVVSHSSYQLQQPSHQPPFPPHLSAASGAPVGSSFSFPSFHHQANLGGPNGPPCAPNLPKTAFFGGGGPLTMHQMIPGYDGGGLPPLNRGAQQQYVDIVESSTNKASQQQIPPQFKGHPQNRPQFQAGGPIRSNAVSASAAKIRALSIGGGGGPSVSDSNAPSPGSGVDFLGQRPQETRQRTSSNNKMQQNVYMTYGSLSLNQQMQKTDWSFIERRIPENFASGPDSNNQMNFNISRSQSFANNFPQSYPSLLDQQQQQHQTLNSNHRANELNSYLGNNNAGMNPVGINQGSRHCPNVNETLPVNFYSNGQADNILQTQTNDWWNADVGLDNGPEMDDESTQNLLQMLNNS